MDFIEMQKEQIAWSEKNFGKQPAHRPLLGIIEELAELSAAWDAKDKPEIIDAVGDVGVYMLDYCGKRGWAMQDLWDLRFQGLDAYWSLMPLIRKLAHHHLKGEQGIRGGAAVHDQALRTVLSDTLGKLQLIAGSVGTDFPTIINAVWAKVRLRDWTKNPNNAHDVAEKSSHESDGLCEDDHS